MATLASFVAVVVAVVFLGIETFVVPIVALGWIASREAVTWRRLAAAGLAVAGTAAGYMVVVVLLRLGLP